MAAKKRPVQLEDIEALVSRARQALDEQGAVKKAALARAVPTRAEVARRLEALGYDVTKSAVRVALDAQLRAALAHGAAISLSSCGDHVAGATATEAKKAALSLVKQGGARLVLRGKALSLFATSEKVLSRAALEKLAGLAKAAASALKDKNGATLLARDVRDQLDAALELEENREKSLGASARPTMDQALVRVLGAVSSKCDARTGLSFVPDVVREVGTFFEPEAARAALVEAAERGLLELRPEGGMGRVSIEDLALCPLGPEGTRLSWARRVDAQE
jgi:hypothetical protein